MKYNTRIAPSPTGNMHIGTARTAYFNWLAARASGGKFLLRIDDTDASRNSQEYLDNILETMDWLGLNYDEMIKQSDRNKRYIYVADYLLTKGTAIKKDNAIFLNVDSIRDSWDDTVAKTIKTNDVDKQHISNLVLIKSDGVATYNFSSVVDDVDNNINYIIRGNDHISNTIKQITIYDALGCELPKFSHIGLIHKDGKKISKRDNALGILHYKELGYSSGAVLNFMLRLGWGPKIDDKTATIIDKDRALELFLNDGNLKASPANMDMNKFEFLKKKYTKKV